MTLGRQLVVMLRAPALGVGKRRLASDLGDLAALQFQRRAADALIRRVGRDPRWTTWLGLTPDASVRRRSLWPGLPRVAQGGGDLGSRMGRMLANAPPGPVILIGADIPGIQARHIAAGFRMLGAHDWVFGPAEDGGYWLIGARRRPSLRLPFAGVRWSSADALSDTLARVQGDIGFLETLADVDQEADLRRLRGQGDLPGLPSGKSARIHVR